MKVDEILQCSFPLWYPTFASTTIESIIIPVPQSVLRYLESDSIFVGDDFPDVTSDTATPHQVPKEGAISAATERRNSASCEQRIPTATSDFGRQVSAAITKLGGIVFPKLNWSSPKDAAWIAPGRTLKCSTVDEILTLLKSSDFVTHDLTEPFILCEDASSAGAVNYVIVLRKWTDIRPGAEFRCFVKEKHLVGVSQRYSDTFFESLEDDSLKVVTTIKKFFDEKIEKHFSLKNFVFDVVLNDDGTVTLLDFNPWGVLTDALLFTWNELEDTVLDRKPELRIVTDQAVRPDPYRRYSIPLDFYQSNLSAHQLQALSAMIENTNLDEQRSLEEMD